jgi:hypothetical protein
VSLVCVRVGYRSISFEFRSAESGMRMNIPLMRTQKHIVTCYKMEEKMYPDIGVSKNQQKQCFSLVVGSLVNETIREKNSDVPLWC